MPPQPGARYLVTGRLQRAGERRRLTRRDMRNLAAYDRFLRGQTLVIVRRSEENEQAKQRYRGIIELDPQFTIDEMTTLMLAEFDAETRFRLRAERGAGKVGRGLALLKKASG